MQKFGHIVFPTLMYICAALPSAAASLSADSINKATFETGRREDSAVLVKAQVLLDRAGFSPGVIDGRQGENFKKALRAFQRRNALDDTGVINRVTFDRLAATSVEPVAAEYEISPKDVRGPVDKVVIDKQERSLVAFDKNGNPVAFYPASIGSEEKPAPSGLFRIRRVDRNPKYHYDPKFRFKGVKTKHELTINPGPNNPVGLVWIDLTAPSYGIHGTPFPDKIGKTESHGCIRLTNWDALALASMVHRGTEVEFSGQPTSRS